MDHPTLTKAENEIVRQVTAGLGAELQREGIPATRWAEVMLAVIVELSGQVLERAPLCGRYVGVLGESPGADWASERRQRRRCILPKDHAAECECE